MSLIQGRKIGKDGGGGVMLVVIRLADPFSDDHYILVTEGR